MFFFLRQLWLVPSEGSLARAHHDATRSKRICGWTEVYRGLRCTRATIVRMVAHPNRLLFPWRNTTVVELWVWKWDVYQDSNTDFNCSFFWKESRMCRVVEMSGMKLRAPTCVLFSQIPDKFTLSSVEAKRQADFVFLHLSSMRSKFKLTMKWTQMVIQFRKRIHHTGNFNRDWFYSPEFLLVARHQKAQSSFSCWSAWRGLNSMARTLSADRSHFGWCVRYPIPFI